MKNPINNLPDQCRAFDPAHNGVKPLRLLYDCLIIIGVLIVLGSCNSVTEWILRVIGG
jgi:hypothetical protein